MKDINEEIFVNKIEKVLIENGFNVWREVIPNECKMWKNPFRVDFIFYRKDIGYVGVEAKNIRSLRQGSIVAKAFEQVKKYKNLTYFNGITIDRWCISFKTSPKDYGSIISTERNILEFLNYFLGYYDIGVLTFDGRIIIGKNTKRALYIPERSVFT